MDRWEPAAGGKLGLLLGPGEDPCTEPVLLRAAYGLGWYRLDVERRSGVGRGDTLVVCGKGRSPGIRIRIPGLSFCAAAIRAAQVELPPTVLLSAHVRVAVVRRRLDRQTTI
ncbi:hypothetical protein GCM10010412_028670 [Nonomuraea recticatena]|uniref:Uncharacterized protein n=1 Tax=Nonomuraea recticatena TaxID=46178 RepID=A0ABN3RQ18_9ACTN